MHIKHTKKDTDLNFTLETSLVGPVLKTLHSSIQWVWIQSLVGETRILHACHETQPKNEKKKKKVLKTKNVESK